MLPFKCLYCNESLNNEFHQYKLKNSILKTCTKRIDHKLKIFSKDGENYSLIGLSIFSNDCMEYLWDYDKKILHLNNKLIVWAPPEVSSVISFHKSLKRLSKLLLIH